MKPSYCKPLEKKKQKGVYDDETHPDGFATKSLPNFLRLHLAILYLEDHPS